MSDSDTVASLLADATHRISEALALDKREARIEARVLLAHALEANHAWLIAHDRDIPTPAQQIDIENLIARRTFGEPVAYIVGEREFFGLNFAVTPAVLIPRPDTELLVETALERLSEHTPCQILDLGTGSGAIGITLARQRPMAAVVAVDTSADALQVAKSNARRLCTKNVQFIASDWYTELGVRKFDMIVSNPPYIATGDPHLDAGDLRFEPSQALSSGFDGLGAIRCIVAGSAAHLRQGGALIIEHGQAQGGACRELFHQAGFCQVASLQDIAAHERVTLGILS